MQNFNLNYLNKKLYFLIIIEVLKLGELEGKEKLTSAFGVNGSDTRTIKML
jgi:hypothetical protein